MLHKLHSLEVHNNNKTLLLLGHKKSKTLSPHYGVRALLSSTILLFVGHFVLLGQLFSVAQQTMVSVREAILLAFVKEVDFFKKNLKNSSPPSLAVIWNAAPHGLDPGPFIGIQKGKSLCFTYPMLPLWLQLVALALSNLPKSSSIFSMMLNKKLDCKTPLAVLFKFT